MSAFQPDRFLRHAPEWVGKLHYFSELGSTNDEAARLGANGAGHGTLVVAEKQTKGRGRRGAAWMSEPGDGLMFSLVVRPDRSLENWGRIALVAGLAVVDVLRRDHGIEGMAKWPNDVMIGQRKCCGILVEAQLDFAVLGLGINVFGAPEGCGYVGESGGVDLSREELLAAMVTAMMEEVANCGTDYESQIDRINAVHFLNGKEVAFESGNTSHEGRVLRVSDAGSLCVQIGEGVIDFPQASNIQPI